MGGMVIEVYGSQKKVAGLRPTKSGAGLAVGWWDGCVGLGGSKSSKSSYLVLADFGFSGKKIFKFFRFFEKNFSDFLKFYFLTLRAKM